MLFDLDINYLAFSEALNKILWYSSIQKLALGRISGLKILPVYSGALRWSCKSLHGSYVKDHEISGCKLSQISEEASKVRIRWRGRKNNQVLLGLLYLPIPIRIGSHASKDYELHGRPRPMVRPGTALWLTCAFKPSNFTRDGSNTKQGRSREAKVREAG